MSSLAHPHFPYSNNGVKRQIISASDLGPNVLIPAVAGKTLIVMNIYFIAGGTVSVKFQSKKSGVSAVDISGLMPFVVDGRFDPSHCPSGHFVTEPSGALWADLSAAVAINGYLTYLEA